MKLTMTMLDCFLAVAAFPQATGQITFTNGKVRGLQYSATALPPGALYAGSQEAVFQMSADVTPPQGWHVTGVYTWSPVRTNDQSIQIPPDSLIVDPPGQTQTAIGRRYGPGVYNVYCTVQIQDSNPPYSFANVNLQGRCAVIGGPITIGVWGGDLGYPATFKNDNNSDTNPFFFEYFNYSHTQPLPGNTQRTQNGNAQVMSQPEGTQVTWTLPSQLISVILGWDPYAQAIDLWAEAEGQALPLSCTFSLNFDDGLGNPPFFLTVPDDTSSSMVRRPDGSTYQMVNSVSCHKPGDTEILFDEQSLPTPYYPDGPVAGRRYRMQVLDTQDAPFPGLWVNERFITALPPAPPDDPWNINGDSDFWTTLMTDGRFEWDYLRYKWFTPAPWSVQSATHEYWAATKSVSGGGIKVGTWEIVFTPPPVLPLPRIGTVQHIKQ
ncbi:MAG: hypothetical protein WAO58_08155 [Fimbriimonadaceae bacterium]